MTTDNLLPLIQLIHRTIREARMEGLDRIGQGRRAVLAVLRASPDMAAAEVVSLVDGVRDGETRSRMGL